ncbi:MAG: hypothetical protein ACFBSC_09555 [Microcoleaceae cyanobacterium]
MFFSRSSLEMAVEGIVFDDDDFANLRDGSLGKSQSVNLFPESFLKTL